MKQTTALRKIASLRKKIRVIQGGQGAGKTIAILILLINHAAGNKNKEIYVISAELSKMRDTVLKDCIKVLRAFNVPCRVTGEISGQPRVDFPNGSFIRFLGLDKDDLGKGLRSDVVFINEANKITFEGYREATSRAKNIYIDFNPNAKFWVHDEIITRDDCDFIKLTFEDNEHIPEAEREEILRYYSMGYDAEGNEISKYWANKWRVYGLGEIGILEGAVFENWEVIEKVPEDAELLGGGIDFGFVNPAACIMVYKLDGQYYFDQLIYETKLTNQDMAEIIIANEMERETYYADSAEPKSIKEIRKEGVRIHPCDGKTDLINHAVQMLNRDTFYVTSQSTETINELHGYIWDMDRKGDPTGKPKKKNDHAMNAMCYFVATEGKYDGTYR